jgi:glycosyltransferase involved in cell wall biosynthesis
VRVLITNCWLDGRTGTELYVRDLALGLLREGHQPMVYSPRHGEVVDELRQAGVRVSDDLAEPLPVPDVVHGHHTIETLAALTRFPAAPGVSVQHDASAWMDEPLDHPRLLRHVAVDELCRERVVAAGIDAARTEVVGNGVDLLRFGERDPLPAVPRRALLLTNSPAGEYVEAIAAGCASRGVVLDVLGAAAGRPVVPEDVLGGYDVVFAKGRTALEALAVGCAVVVCDRGGVAGMLTTEVLEEWRRWNFGRRLLVQRHTPEVVTAELDRYDPADAARCTSTARSRYGLDVMVQRLVEVYEAVAKEHDPDGYDLSAELVRLGPQVARLGPLRVTENAYLDLQPYASLLQDQVVELRAESARREEDLQGLREERTALERDRARLEAELAESVAAGEALAAELRVREQALQHQREETERAQQEGAAAAAMLRAVEGTATFRARAALLRNPLGKALVRLRGLGRR